MSNEKRIYFRKCQSCKDQHPDLWPFCPYSGEPVVSDSYVEPGMSTEAWDELKNVVDGMSARGLQELGLVRIDQLAQAEADARPRISEASRQLALESRSLDEAAIRMSALPLAEDGSVDWDLAGPAMNRELHLARFIVEYCVGGVENLEFTTRSILNEWHGLKRTEGLDG